MRAQQVAHRSHHPSPPIAASPDTGNLNHGTGSQPGDGFHGQESTNRRLIDEESEWSSAQMPSELDAASDHDDSGILRGSRGRLEGHITSADLLNPSDALDLLAQVANLDPQGQGHNQEDVEVEHHNIPEASRGLETSKTRSIANYPPISSGALSLLDVASLLQEYAYRTAPSSSRDLYSTLANYIRPISYYSNFHIFFPIAYKVIFDDPAGLAEWIEKEQHLITAILTVVTKDDPTRLKVHEAFAQHMETLISKLIYAGSTDVGAVEALLILAEWSPQPPEDSLAIGTGKENQGSWMLVGLAIRLAYLQNLEQTTLTHGQAGVSEHICRQRTVWAGKSTQFT